MLKGDLNQRIIAKEASFKKVCTLNVSNPVFKEEIYKFVFLYVVRSHISHLLLHQYIYIYALASNQINSKKLHTQERKKEKKKKTFLDSARCETNNIL